jgi:hypothetical protein
VDRLSVRLKYTLARRQCGHPDDVRIESYYELVDIDRQSHRASHGLAWYEFDPSWLLIKVLRFFGVAKAIRVAKVSSAIAEREAA